MEDWVRGRGDRTGGGWAIFSHHQHHLAPGLTLSQPARGQREKGGVEVVETSYVLGWSNSYP